MFTEEEIKDLLKLLNAVKQNLKIIIAATVLGLLIGFGATKLLMTPQYEASINMIVNTRADSTTTVTNDNITSAKNLVDTYAIIIKSNLVLNNVIDNLKLDTTYKQLASQVTVQDINNTQVMKITVRDPDINRARDVVDSISKIAPKVIINSVEAGSVKIVSEVELSDGPVSPKTTRNTALRGIVFMVCAMGIVIIKELFNNTVADDTDVEKYLELSVLGVIPELEGEDRK